MDNRLGITVHELASRLGIGRNAAYDLTNSAGFPVLKIGKRTVIPVEPLNRWIETQAAQQNASITRDTGLGA